MFEIWPIGTGAKFEPIEKVEAEISSVELIAELIEVELQEITLDVVIRIKDASLGITYGDMYPWEYFAHKGLVFHYIRVMTANNAMVDEGSVRTRSICGRLCLVVNGGFISDSSVVAFKSGITIIFIWPTRLPVL